MNLVDPMTVVFLVGVSLAAAALAVLAAGWVQSRSAAASHVRFQGMNLPIRYSFRDGYLTSDCGPEDIFLADPEDRVGAWEDLVRALAPLCPDVRDRMSGLRQRRESFVLIGKIGEDQLSVTGRPEGASCVITISPHDKRHEKRSVDKAGLDALEAEVDLLRNATDFSTDVMWQEDSAGQIIWANRNYFDLLSRIDERREAMVWPIDKVFRDHTTPPPETGHVRRAWVVAPGQEDSLWFDLCVREEGETRFYTASPIDRLVAAESSLRDFVQTLSRTFAHLPIGLAIFDKSRQLVLFNPALVSLSDLPTDWLSSRPDLFSFLDQLRENQRMPEPKDYQAWRASLAEVEQAARDGTYQEMWSLPNGQTFRVMGRPHADGAVAFLFEDITSEVGLTRQFRGELDLFQAIWDDRAEAMAVFSKEGKLVMTNRAYDALWPLPETGNTLPSNVIEATHLWQSDCAPTPLWGEIRDFVGGFSERSAWQEHEISSNQGMLRCRVAPLSGGASLVEFAKETTGIPARDNRGAVKMRQA